jgi:hypothetical protein
MELENGKALKEGIQLQHTHNNTKMQVKFHLFLDVKLDKKLGKMEWKTQEKIENNCRTHIHSTNMFLTPCN